ncbi:hypothetical protein BZG36_00778 [Bifiguratus adelaidae]|uniref:Protein disulfide-isomerase n=1 Tax=Bifiguratus adelaidae TaxID=1938954 RepID=A0A261Y6R9_9FUNG|nr:hypothetical protein BZG36_00778 [Bifiguratus adelaidae]
MSECTEDYGLAVLCSIFEGFSESSLLSQLRQYEGNVQQTIDSILESPRRKKRKVQATLFRFKEPRPRPRLDHPLHSPPFSPSIPDRLPLEPTTQSSKSIHEVLKWTQPPPSRRTHPPTLHLFKPEDVYALTPCTMIPNVLPKDLANEVLETMIRESDTWKRNQWWLFERPVTSPHTTAFYISPAGGTGNDMTGDLYYNGKKCDDARPMPECMEKARQLVEDILNKVLDKRERHPWEVQGRWTTNVAAAHCYANSKESVAMHSDRITYLGPRPVIASLSLGVSRQFRLRRVATDSITSTHTKPTVPQEDKPMHIPPTQHELDMLNGWPKDIQEGRLISIELPNNSLVIMNPPMQEEWKHEIVSQSTITPHPISGFKRINITYRNYRPEFQPQHIPVCACGIPCVLRAVQQNDSGNIGRYFYMCYGAGVNEGKACDFFQWWDPKTALTNPISIEYVGIKHVTRNDSRSLSLFSMLKKVFVACALSAAVLAVQSSDVLELTQSKFNEVVKPEKLMLVEFFAPWCGHCKALAPEYELAATQLKESNIKLAKVDCTVETDLCSEYEVRGYPTLKVFREGESTEYNGARKADGIVSYMKKQALPALSEVSPDNFETFKTSDKVVVVGFISESDKDSLETLNSVANKLRDDFLFGVVSDEETAKSAGVSAPAVVLYKAFDDGENKFDGALTAEELTNFVRTSSVPLLAEIDGSNYAKYMEAGLPLAYLFADNDDDRAKLIKEIEPVAKEFKGKVNFVHIDAAKYGGHAQNLNLKEQWPAFGIQKVADASKYPFDQSKDITTKNLRSFVTDFFAGKIAPSIKSAPIPETNDGPVKVVVADQFDEIVYDSDKDVFVEFYAPWCGHCKRLAPIWDQFATDIAANPANSHIVIAKMDATENDLPARVPFQIQGFPTLKLFKAGKDKEIVDYNGDRSYDDLINFLKTNSENGVTIEKPTTEDVEDAIDHDELPRYRSWERRLWVWLCWTLTFWIPSILLHHLGGLKRGSDRMVFREKITICLLLIGLSTVFVLILELGSEQFCKTPNHYYYNDIVDPNNSLPLIAVNGNAYSFDPHRFPPASVASEVIQTIQKYPHHDLSNLFPTFTLLARVGTNTTYTDPVIQACVNSTDVADRWLWYRIGNDTGYEVTNQRLTGCPDPHDPTMPSAPCFYTTSDLQDLSEGMQGDVVFRREDLHRYCSSLPDCGVVVLDGRVYNVTSYLNAATTLTSRSSTVISRKLYVDRMFLPLNLTEVLLLNLGMDITADYYANVTNPTLYKECLDRLFYIGITEDAVPVGCYEDNPLLWAIMGLGLLFFLFKIILGNIARLPLFRHIRAKLTRTTPLSEKSALKTGASAYPFSGFGSRNLSQTTLARIPYTILMVPCFAEPYEELKRNIESLAMCHYNDARTLLMFVCDGIVTNTNSQKETHQSVLDILGYSGTDDPVPQPYVSLGQGAKKSNLAQVFSGYYEAGSNRVPYIVVVKIGNRAELWRPEQPGQISGNRGKMDSILLLFEFLERCMDFLHNKVTPLDYEIHHHMYNVLGMDPRLFEYVLVMDADTSIKLDTVSLLIEKMQSNPKLMAVSGDIRARNAEASVITMLQIFQMYLTGFSSLSFEECWGSVVSLSGGLVMYRVWSGDVRDDGDNVRQRYRKLQALRRDSKWSVDEGTPVYDGLVNSPKTSRTMSQLLLSPMEGVRPCCVHPTVLREIVGMQANTLHTRNLLLQGEDQYLATVLLRSLPHMRLGFEPRAIALTVIPNTFLDFQAQQRRMFNATFHNLIELCKLPLNAGILLRILAMYKLAAMLFLPVVVLYLYTMMIRVCISSNNGFEVTLLAFASLVAVHTFYFVMRLEFKYVAWLLLYIVIACPLYCVWFPVYAIIMSDRGGQWYDLWKIKRKPGSTTRMHGNIDDITDAGISEPMLQAIFGKAAVDSSDPEQLMLELGEVPRKTLLAYEQGENESSEREASLELKEDITLPNGSFHKGHIKPWSRGIIPFDYSAARSTRSGVQGNGALMPMIQLRNDIPQNMYTGTEMEDPFERPIMVEDLLPAMGDEDAYSSSVEAATTSMRGSRPARAPSINNSMLSLDIENYLANPDIHLSRFERPPQITYATHRRQISDPPEDPESDGRQAPSHARLGALVPPQSPDYP